MGVDVRHRCCVGGRARGAEHANNSVSNAAMILFFNASIYKYKDFLFRMMVV